VLLRLIRRPFLNFAALCALAVCLGACAPGERALLERALVGRGRVVVIGDVSALQLKPLGTQLIALQGLPALAQQASGNDSQAFASALTQAHIQGVLVDVQSASKLPALAGQLAHYARVPGLQGAYFNRDASLYVLDPLRVWNQDLRAGLAEVARRLIAGSAPPRLSSFPEPVRRLDPVEVMVLLRSGTQARLWRSARGSSFARALLTAAEVARQRWIERSSALGGRLDEMLPQMSVELSLLQDDGEIGVHTAAFVDHVVLPVHGVGYERKGGWHYLLPDATRSGGRQPSRAFAQLFAEDGLSDDSLGNPELRLYRLAVERIAISEPTQHARSADPDDGLSEVKNPAQVLGR
jgi:hypothetical protein